MAAITGSGITGSSVFSRIIQVLLAIYSVAVFAILAGTLGGQLPETKGRREVRRGTFRAAGQDAVGLIALSAVGVLGE